MGSKFSKTKKKEPLKKLRFHVNVLANNGTRKVLSTARKRGSAPPQFRIKNRSNPTPYGSFYLNTNGTIKEYKLNSLWTSAENKRQAKESRLGHTGKFGIYLPGINATPTPRGSYTKKNRRFITKLVTKNLSSYPSLPKGLSFTRRGEESNEENINDINNNNDKSPKLRKSRKLRKSLPY